MRDRVKQHVHGDDRAGHRDHDAEENGQIVGAVDLGRLRYRVVDVAVQVGARDDDVPRHRRGRQHHCPARCVQHQVAHDDERRDDAAAEPHGERDVEHQQAAATESPSRQGIRHHERDRDIDRGAHLLESYRHHLSHIEDHQDDDGGSDARQRDEAKLLPAVGAVHPGGIVLLLIDGGERGKVDDGAPPEVLPDVGPDIQRPPTRFILAT